MTLETTIAQAAEALDDVLAVWIFGSQADGTARDDSDVDVAVLERLGLPSESAWTCRSVQVHPELLHHPVERIARRQAERVGGLLAVAQRRRQGLGDLRRGRGVGGCLGAAVSVGVAVAGRQRLGDLRGQLQARAAGAGADGGPEDGGQLAHVEREVVLDEALQQLCGQRQGVAPSPNR